VIEADPAQLLDAGGPFARLLDGFAPRRQQQEMATAIATVLDEGSLLVSEAGTGTGKTFAYLVPALLSGKKVVVSTGTRHLQDQLYHRDLPLVREALDVPVRAALLKGRANYLCRYRLQQSLAAGRFRSREQAAEATAIRDWAGRTRSGDVAEMTGIAEESRIWPLVTSTTDNCLGQECPDYADCFLVPTTTCCSPTWRCATVASASCCPMPRRGSSTRRTRCRRSPGASSATRSPASSCSDWHATPSPRSSTRRDEAPDSTGLRDLAAGLEKGVADLRLALGRGEVRAAWSSLFHRGEATAALDVLHDALSALQAGAEAEAGRGKGLESCARRAADGLALLEQLSEEVDGAVRWVQTTTRGFVLNRTPLDIAEPLREQMLRYPGAWVFTSATLAVGDSFTHYTERLGLPGTALRAARHAGATRPGLRRPGARRRTVADRGVRGALLSALHQPPRAARGGRGARRPARLPAAGAGRGAARRAARTLQKPRQRRAARHQQLLGRCRRARRGALVRGHRQAAVRGARRPGAAGAR
jgi:ATP-dependent DNA helicase DinG